MAKSLPSVCLKLQNIAAGLNIQGLLAPDYPKDHIFAPAVVTYPERGEIDSEQVPATKGLHTVITEFHFQQTELALSVAMAIPIVESFAKAVLADPLLGGTCDTVVGPIRYEFGKLSWGGEQESHMGIRFRIVVKIRATS